MRFLSLSLLMAACSLPLLAEEAAPANAAPAPHGAPAGAPGEVAAAGEDGVVVEAGAAEPGKWADATYLGLMTESIPLVRAEDLHLPAGTGLSVAGVAPDSPAAKAGFQNGDVLAKFGDQTLVNPAQLRVLMRMQKPGDTVSFQVVRKGKPQEIKAVLGSRRMPELAPGGEEPRMLLPRIGQGQFKFPEGVQIMPLGEGALPPEIAKQLPPEIRDQLKRAGMLGAPPAKLHGVDPDDDAQDEDAGVLPAAPAPGNVVQTMKFSSRIICNDGGNKIEVERGEHESLRITDKDGKELYKGAIPANDKEWEKVPEGVRGKAKSMVSNQRVIIQGNGGLTIKAGGAAQADAPQGGGKPGKEPADKPGQSF